jgi:hypothetical protein
VRAGVPTYASPLLALKAQPSFFRALCTAPSFRKFFGSCCVCNFLKLCKISCRVLPSLKTVPTLLSRYPAVDLGRWDCTAIMYHNWRSIAVAIVLACTNAQDMPNLGDVLANQTDLSTFYGLIQVGNFGLILSNSSCRKRLKMLGSRSKRAPTDV